MTLDPLDALFLAEHPFPDVLRSRRADDRAIGTSLLARLARERPRSARSAHLAAAVLARTVRPNALLELASDPAAPTLGRAAAALALAERDARVSPPDDRLAPFLEATIVGYLLSGATDDLTALLRHLLAGDDAAQWLRIVEQWRLPLAVPASLVYGDVLEDRSCRGSREIVLAALEQSAAVVELCEELDLELPVGAVHPWVAAARAWTSETSCPDCDGALLLAVFDNSDGSRTHAEVHVLDGAVVETGIDPVLLASASDARLAARDLRPLTLDEAVDLMPDLDDEGDEPASAAYLVSLLAWRAAEELAQEEPRAGHIDWVRAVRGKPTDDVLDALDGDLDDAVDAVMFALEGGRYAIWEAAIREEQGLVLDDAQAEVLDELIGDDDEPMLYLDELGRPTEPWYASVRRLADAMLARRHTGWPQLEAAIEEHAGPLERPDGLATPIDVVPSQTRHALRVLGQLRGDADPAEASELLDDLWWVRESVEALGLTPRGISALGGAGEPLASALATAAGIGPDDPIAPRLTSPSSAEE